ncbi:plasmid mobilization relaxosome protein MobC [Achromobacter xylosoxidans]|uniref:plasmid mobilization relaxosome protein MobC n=1 Tax=Alcaligenes xylosoxydans xylosoxydans TaxID=85698 RepID=UPI0009EB05B1|nr:plasmid mobilization relaxosome protein MobC [Achromobacter xylosoxidans]
MMKVKKHLWITKEQDEKLKLHRKTFGLNNGEFFRSCIDKDFIYIKPFLKLTKEINKIGVNLNQIAYRCNSNEEIDELTLNELISINEKLNELLKEMRKKNDNKII